MLSALHAGPCRAYHSINRKPGMPMRLFQLGVHGSQRGSSEAAVPKRPATALSPLLREPGDLRGGTQPTTLNLCPVGWTGWEVLPLLVLSPWPSLSCLISVLLPLSSALDIIQMFCCLTACIDSCSQTAEMCTGNAYACAPQFSNRDLCCLRCWL